MFCPRCKALLYRSEGLFICKRCGYKRRPLSITVRFKDWWIKGLQLNRCYVPHWEEITHTFEEYGVDLNRQGPIITMQTLKQVRLAKEITESIKDNPKIRAMANRSVFPIRTVQNEETTDKEKIIDGNIFVAVLRLVPEFTLRVGAKQLMRFLENGSSEKYLGEVLSTTGTILDTANDIEEVVKKMEKSAFKPKQ